MDMILCAKTLGRRPGCVVVSIGATLFDRDNLNSNFEMDPKNHFYEAISARNSDELKFTSDPETLKWWKKQPYWPILGLECMNSNNSVKDTCQKLTEFIEEHKPAKIWSNSPTFHSAVIKSLYARTGLVYPVEYRQEMDYRTLLDVVYPNRDSRPLLEAPKGFPKQHATGDALTQAMAIKRAIYDMGQDSFAEIANQKWMMLDTETLGRTPGSVVLSVGANVFSASTNYQDVMSGDKHFYEVINSFDSQNVGLKVEPETLRWWKKKEIWADLGMEVAESKTTVKKMCQRFSEFINDHNPDKFWANSPVFDIEILSALFKKSSIEFPIQYRKEMDFRTIMELAYPDRNLRPTRELSEWYPEHHALGDSIEQSFQLQKAFMELNIAPTFKDDIELNPRKIGTNM